MRDIIFRAKRVDTGEWVEGNLLFNYDPQQEESVIREAFIRTPLGNLSTHYKVIPETVGQFTGLTDKNGVRIFEGDLMSNNSVQTIEIVFEEQAFRREQIGFFYQYSKSVLFYDDILNFNLKVTGNIHDKPIDK